MSRGRKRSFGEAGLSMIEVLVALSLLAVMTVGIAPLLASSIRGTSLTRSRTSGKNVATEAMERIRGLPFFESVQGQTTPSRRDVLDIYFPDRGAGFSSTSNTFTTVCTSTTPAAGTRELVACPKNIPGGYAVTFVAAFVKPGSGTPQTFTVQPPGASYSWSSTSTENPPTELLRMAITVSWSYGNEPQSFNLTSLIGERVISGESISGSGEVDHAVRILTSLRNSSGVGSRLVAIAGESDSHIATRAYAVASQSTSAAHVVMTREAVAETSAATLADVSGHSIAVSAPPNAYPAAPGAVPPDQTVQYQYDASTQIPVGFIDNTVVEAPAPFSLGAQVANELPRAAGKYRFTGSDSEWSFWIDNQAQRGLTSPLKLDDSSHMVALDRGGTRLAGQSTAESTSVGGIRKVETKASTSFGKLYMLPTTFITDPDDAVITISDFTASLTCSSTANLSTAVATGTWSATLKYWRDSSNDGLAAGGYVEQALSGSTVGGADPLASLRSLNPLVYDDPDNSKDVYLFETATTRGYLTSIASLPGISVRKTDAGRVTSAELNGAIQMETAATSASNPQTKLNISIGALSCEAVDRRGI